MDTPASVLVVEDEFPLARMIATVLMEEGYRVHVEHDGNDALAAAVSVPPDIALIDIGLPSLDGLAVCRELRQRKLDVPIILLTARDAIPDRVAGLDAGADDYLIKPFAFEELLARMRAHLKRSAQPSRLTLADLVMDTDARSVTRSGVPIELTAQEFSLLETLIRHAGTVCTRQQLLDHVWGYLADPTSNVVDLYVHYLRRKIDAPFDVKLIHTVRSVGYMAKA